MQGLQENCSFPLYSSTLKTFSALDAENVILLWVIFSQGTEVLGTAHGANSMGVYRHRPNCCPPGSVRLGPRQWQCRGAERRPGLNAAFNTD